MARKRLSIMPKNKSFLDFPPEIRRAIYRYVFSASTFIFLDPRNASKHEMQQFSARTRLGLCFVCKQIKAEITPDLISDVTIVIKPAGPRRLKYGSLSECLKLATGLKIRMLALHHSCIVDIPWEMDRHQKKPSDLRWIETLTVYGSEEYISTAQPASNESGVPRRRCFYCKLIAGDPNSSRWFDIEPKRWSQFFTNLREVFVQLVKCDDKVFPTTHS